MHSTLSVSGLQCILRTQVLFSREIRVIFSWQLTYEKLVSQKKKTYGSWSHTKTVTNSALLQRLPVQIQCHRRDLAGHEENMSPGLETEAQDLAEPELAWTNKSGANHVKEPQEKGSVSEDSPRLFCN